VPDGSGLARPFARPGTEGVYPVWSPRGDQLAVTLDKRFPHLVTLATGAIAPLPRFERDALFATPWSWSPDGRWLAMNYAHGVVLHELDTGIFDVLTSSGEWPVFLPDGQRLLFHDKGGLHVVDRTTRRRHEVVRLARGPGDEGALPWAGRFALSPDARFVYYTHVEVEADIWVAALTH
jgi:Tol biopolymer transport system component